MTNDRLSDRQGHDFVFAPAKTRLVQQDLINSDERYGVPK